MNRLWLLPAAFIGFLFGLEIEGRTRAAQLHARDAALFAATGCVTQYTDDGRIIFVPDVVDHPDRECVIPREPDSVQGGPS